MKNIKILIILLLILYFPLKVFAPSFNNEDLLKYQKERYQKQYKLITDSLIKEVQYYIDKYAKGSLLDVELLIRLSDLYDIDLRLVLAQGHLESHFGTRGRATKTYSLFNVGSYDDGTVLYQYSNPNYSIEPYMRLLKDKYLVNKNMADLLNDKFVNTKGKRYATQPTYEKELLKIINLIDNKTSIHNLIQIRKIASLFEDKTTFEYAFEYQINNNYKT
jgi:flagellum-specific peptidoglycan hydrolase FlgJ